LVEYRNHTKTERKARARENFRCKQEHLRMPISIFEAEKLGVVTDPLGRAPALPFGHLNGAWLEFIGRKEVYFNLWYFEVPLENAQVRYVRACRGLVWARARKVQAEFVFETN